MRQIFILKEPLNKIKEPSDIFKKIHKFKMDYKQENLILFVLNNANKVIKSEILFKGGVDSSIVCPVTLFRNILKCGGNKFIIAHNHPSNNLNPSSQDIDLKSKLNQMGKVLELQLLDFIIFNKKEFYSLKNEGEI